MCIRDSLKAAGIDMETPVLATMTGKVSELNAAMDALEAAIDGFHGDTVEAESEYALGSLIPAMTGVREVSDALESIVADDLWPLPTYNEMLTIL